VQRDPHTGRIHIVGRLKHTYKISNCEKYAPEALECILESCDGVASLFIHGRADEVIWAHFMGSFCLVLCPSLPSPPLQHPCEKFSAVLCRNAGKRRPTNQVLNGSLAQAFLIAVIRPRDVRALASWASQPLEDYLGCELHLALLAKLAHTALSAPHALKQFEVPRVVLLEVGVQQLCCHVLRADDSGVGCRSSNLGICHRFPPA
jgi:hypothetical protein